MADLIFIPGDNSAESLDFAERYTRGVYKKTTDETILAHIEQLKHQYPFDDPNYCHIIRNVFDAKDYQLSRQETVAFINCMACDKIRINNYIRYCSKENCPYYFNFDAIIASRDPIED